MLVGLLCSSTLLQSYYLNNSRDPFLLENPVAGASYAPARRHWDTGATVFQQKRDWTKSWQDAAKPDRDEPNIPTQPGPKWHLLATLYGALAQLT